MKQIKFGDITEVTSGIIMHGCNAQGVMGSGIAKEVRAKWPKAYEHYHLACKKAGPSYMLSTVVPVEVEPGLIIANAITQLNFGGAGTKYVSYKAVQECFIAVANLALKEHLASKEEMTVHYPLIGAGLGGGDWAIISEIIDNVFDQPKYASINRTLWIYE